jgi:hypothetical protein
MRVCDFMYVPTAADRRCWQMSVDPPASEEIDDRDVKSGEVWGRFANEIPPCAQNLCPWEVAKFRLYRSDVDQRFDK